MAGKKKDAGKDGEKSDASKENSPEQQQKEEASAKEEPFVAMDALHENLQLLEASVQSKDQNGLKRVLRKNTAIRKTIAFDDFGLVMDVWIPPTSSLNKQLHSELSAAARGGAESALVPENEEEVEFLAKRRKEYTAMDVKTDTLPETEAYLSLFAIKALMDGGRIEQAQDSASQLLEMISAENRRTLDLFQAKAYQFKARCAELLGDAAALRPELLSAHRTACLRLDEQGQAMLINLILRNYTEANLVDQAVKFAFKAHFPESASNNQQVRHLYYMGRLSALQLDYSVAFQKLTQAIRKAPSNTGLGFRIALHKLASIVQLLMGETPERSWFAQPEMEVPLAPYFELVRAVRNGSLAEYDRVREARAAVFAEDKLATLVVRLRNSVIRTGLRRINVSYSRISFKDIAKRLALDQPESAELACAKAIRDGVIEATLNHEKGYMKSSDVMDIYSTIEPQQAFHRRIQFCLDMHNEAVKSMRYPPDAHKVKHDQTEDDDDLEKKSEEELAKEIEEELEEDED
ncbi:26S proteasome non-ATPase regulatory subunit 3 [Hondaea fermentalgiana]|uniref:26S proteasome non-ATPase regulatory subunit 3 n=1 Tax=Hondaea fermentalgiana TaxID=2315210 RepID=A0A2R5GTG6_9STRA|nr:26S proteasome non-ATPase regulatory subunit 3 [Hondaea fermentalgiana]|eukprot:GBG34130.1 26S proteasome non-ATPase regulatory subunit 3 [Hondaea fermentalgiana]